MVNSLLRGGYYDTIYTKKCSMYHPCLVTKKCQHYDPNRRQCFLCEQRVRPNRNLKGVLPEGVYTEDVQLAVRVIQDFMKRPMVDPDGKGLQGVPLASLEKFKRATDIMSRYTNVAELPDNEIY